MVKVVLVQRFGLSFGYPHSPSVAVIDKPPIPVSDVESARDLLSDRDPWRVAELKEARTIEPANGPAHDPLQQGIFRMAS